MSEPSEQAGAAAFFDLDRTLLRGASGPILSEAMRKVGLIPERRLGIESALFKVFDVIGETWPSMFVTRQGARMSNGWALDRVREAAEQAAGPLADHVLPNARKLIDEHHDAGRVVVMATTTPVDLVAPAGGRLGFDDVIATRYGRRDGRLDGTIDGLFVLGQGQGQAVAAVGIRRRHRPRSQLRLLRQLLRRSAAVDRRPSLRGQSRSPAASGSRRFVAGRSCTSTCPAGVPKFLGIEPQKALMLMAQPQLFPWVRFELDGVDKHPR